jgi:hypothetical protein
VIQSSAFVFDNTRYAKQKPSILAIHFDKIEAPNATWGANLSVRALANVLEVNKAKVPYRTDETDTPGTMIQIGGDQYIPGSHRVFAGNGEDVVAYKRGQGVFARLIADNQFGGGGSILGCDATMTEQSVAIFSAGACGLYGFADDVAMTANGSRNGGTFRLDSAHHTMKLYSHSAALLEETNPTEASK